VELAKDAKQAYYYTYVLEKESASIDTFAAELEQVFHELFDDLATRLQ
jgi:asparagine synthase (glutamine-hydrolysing)